MRKAFKFPIKDKDFKRRRWCGNRPKCVEVAVKPREVAVRDSKNLNGGVLFFTKSEFKAFVKGVKGGEFDI